MPKILQLQKILSREVKQLFDLKVSDYELETLLPTESTESREEIFSQIAWSVICEPGDGLAGLMVQTLGAKRALVNELESVPAQEVRAQLIAAGLDSFELDQHDAFEKGFLVGRERWRPRISLTNVRQALFRIQQSNGFVITPMHPAWPGSLDDLRSHSPMALWIRGSLESLQKLQKSVAVVGCRGSSSYGELATQNMVSAAVEKGFSIVSGGAYGIDGIAHRCALALKANTVAVMAGGVDKFYPSGHADLLKRISETGAVISELPPGSAPTKWRFLQRNRLIAALSQATLVVEANWRSGALNTATHAQTLERPLLAVPGPITSPKSAGTNKLIADERATLVVDGRDFLDRLGARPELKMDFELAGLGSIETRVLDALGFNSLELSEVCAEAGLTRDEARFGLGNLELDGFVVRRGSAWTKSQTTL